MYDFLGVDVFAVKPEDLDPNQTAYWNMMNLIRLRFPADSHIRNMAEFLHKLRDLKPTANNNFITISEKELRTFGLNKSLENIYEKNRPFLSANLSITLSRMESGEVLLCVDWRCCSDAFRLLLSNSFNVYTYFLSKVAVLLDQVVGNDN